MNERILELAKQARKYAQQYVNESVIPYGKTASEFARIFESKFAELIVQECIFQYDEWAGESSDQTSFRMARHNVKKHFGVE